MGRNNRYRQMEHTMTQILLADAAVFVLYLLFAACNVVALKWITAIIAIIASGLCLGFLYMTGELLKKRSLWLTMGFGSVVLCTLVSLILSFPGPV